LKTFSGPELADFNHRLSDLRNSFSRKGSLLMNKLLIALAVIGLSLLMVACGQNTGKDAGKVLKSTSLGNNLTVTLSNAEGALKHGDEQFFISFKDGAGQPVDVGACALNFQMPAMGTMPAMNDAASFVSTGTKGVYQGRVKIESAGDWQAQLSYEGAAGKGKTQFTVTVQ
jgi:hypothetical protein